MQSIICFGLIFALSLVFGYIPYIGGILGMLLSLISLALWIVGIIKSYQGEKYKFPIIGDIAEKYL